MLLLKYVGTDTFYPCDFNVNSDRTIVTLKGDFPHYTGGFFLSREGFEEYDMWDYTAYETIYKELPNGVQFSNNGSVYVEPIPEPVLKRVTVKVNWNDGNNINEERPAVVHVKVLLNGEAFETLTFSNTYGWSKTYTDVPEEDVYTVEVDEEVENYDVWISGTTVNFSTDYVLPEVITVETRLADLESAVCELANLILGIEEEEEEEEIAEEPIEDTEELDPEEEVTESDDEEASAEEAEEPAPADEEVTE